MADRLLDADLIEPELARSDLRELQGTFAGRFKTSGSYRYDGSGRRTRDYVPTLDRGPSSELEIAKRIEARWIPGVPSRRDERGSPATSRGAYGEFAELRRNALAASRGEAPTDNTRIRYIEQAVADLKAARQRAEEKPHLTPPGVRMLDWDGLARRAITGGLVAPPNAETRSFSEAMAHLAAAQRLTEISGETAAHAWILTGKSPNAEIAIARENARKNLLGGLATLSASGNYQGVLGLRQEYVTGVSANIAHLPKEYGTREAPLGGSTSVETLGTLNQALETAARNAIVSGIAAYRRTAGSSKDKALDVATPVLERVQYALPDSALAGLRGTAQETIGKEFGVGSYVKGLFGRK
jgi:hypothetical protein